MDFLSGKVSGSADVRVVVQDHQDHQDHQDQDHQDHQPFMVFLCFFSGLLD